MAEKKINYKVIIIGLTIFTCIVIWMLYESYLLDKHPRYTIGEITHIEGTKGGYQLWIFFKVNSIAYKKFGVIQEKNKSLIGKRYIVKFEEGDPENCHLMFEFPVTDTLIDIPAEGWSYIPIKLYAPK